MILYKIEDAIAEARPGLSHADLLNMPFYEFMLKLDIMKDRAEEREKKEKNEMKNQQSKFKPADYKQPKLPKMPSHF
jgi:hypothetical protein